MVKLRLHFQKSGRARFISHLDLMQVLKRALLRAELPLRYSEGFNPHAILSIALPLPVGVAGMNEIMDFELTHPIPLGGLSERINNVLPEGISVLNVELAGKPVKDIAAARYEIIYLDAHEHMLNLKRVFDGQALPVEKRTKKGTTLVDIATLVQVESISICGDGLRLQICLPTQPVALSPEHVLAAVKTSWPECEHFNVSSSRLATLDNAGCEF